jgi:sphingosine kinase
MEEYCGILALGGDGTLHEILNGIMRRSDWIDICNTWTLGASPLGNHNRIYETNRVAHDHTHRDHPLETCLMIAKGTVL